MQHRLRLLPLFFSQAIPSLVARLAGGDATGSGRHPVQDRPVKRLVDDFVVSGHSDLPLGFNPRNLTHPPHGRYVETSEIVL